VLNFNGFAFLKSGSFDVLDKVKIGAWRDETSPDQGNQLGISFFASKVFTQNIAADIKSLTGTSRLAGTLSSTTYSLKAGSYNEENPYGRVSSIGDRYTIVEDDRSGLNWGSSSAFTGGCGAGCICSTGVQPAAGDLHVCLKKKTAKFITVVAGVTGDESQGFSLGPTDTLKSGPLLQDGYFLKVNERLDVDQMFGETTSAVGTMLLVLRVVFPIMMCIGFYCCLNPILWLIDTVGDTLGEIPCVGGMLEGVAECFETLAEIVICIVSCCAACACSLFIGALAWVWYRPSIGIPLLLGSLVVFACLGGFAMSRRGQKKVRGRKSARQQNARQPQFATEMAQAQPQPQPWQSEPAPAIAMAIPVQPTPQQMQVVCPEGCFEGSMIQVTAPDGRMLQVQVPMGIQPGQPFMIQI
jgi:hypothetical protein